MFTPADRRDEHRPAPGRRDADPAKPADVAHPVTVDLVAMSALEPGADMALSIPDHGDYSVTYDRTEPATPTARPGSAT
jgi:hypothetical protein